DPLGGRAVLLAARLALLAILVALVAADDPAEGALGAGLLLPVVLVLDLGGGGAGAGSAWGPAAGGRLALGFRVFGGVGPCVEHLGGDVAELARPLRGGGLGGLARLGRGPQGLRGTWHGLPARRPGRQAVPARQAPGAVAGAARARATSAGAA